MVLRADIRMDGLSMASHPLPFSPEVFTQVNNLIK
jgi:hypothetical protein